VSAGAAIFQDQVRLALTQKIAYSHNMPTRVGAGEVSIALVGSVLKKPEYALPSAYIFPDQVRVAIIVKVLGNSTTFRRG
jgi:hypothetical protein